MVVRTFSAVVSDAGDGWVYAHVPELPEVQSLGESLDQARLMVAEDVVVGMGEVVSHGESFGRLHRRH